MKKVIHLGDAGKGTITCGAKEQKIVKNWVWVPQQVTCKKCLNIYKKRISV